MVTSVGLRFLKPDSVCIFTAISVTTVIKTLWN